MTKKEYMIYCLIVAFIFVTTPITIAVINNFINLKEDQIFKLMVVVLGVFYMLAFSIGILADTVKDDKNSNKKTK